MSRAFILHDGENETENTELDTFLSPLRAANGDWEGDNSGVTIWMPHVNVGDAIVVDHEGLGVRIYPKGEKIKITRHAFSNVYDAMLAVEHDNGAHHANRIHPGMVDLDTFTMPFDYGIDRLLNADEALGWLSRCDTTELEDLMIGCEEDQLAVIKKYGDEHPGLKTAHELINDWFCGWERPYAWES